MRRQWRRWWRIDTPAKDTSSADTINFGPPVVSRESEHDPGQATHPRLPHARETREQELPDVRKRGNGEDARGAQHKQGDDTRYTWEPEFAGSHVIHATK